MIMIVSSSKASAKTDRVVRINKCKSEANF